MRVLDKTAFLALPEGVLFAEGEAWNFGGMEVKGETITVGGRACGYWSAGLQWVDGHDDIETTDILARMKGEGISHPMDTSYSKALPVDDDALFLVYEDDDIDVLMGLLREAKGLVKR